MRIVYGSVALVAVLLVVAAAVFSQKEIDWSRMFPARSVSAEASESVTSESDSKIRSASDSSGTAESQEESASEPEPSENTEEAWKLILVNADHTIDASFQPELAEVQNGYEMDRRVVEDAQRMIGDAEEQGVDLLVCSAFRSYNSQQRNFDRKVQSLEEAGYNRTQAVQTTLTVIARPGSSEHQTGLALDIVTPSYQGLDDGYEQTDAAKWLKTHAAEYGFILRYPKGKEAVTQISFEPWHYRYVGVDAAQEIMSNELCLEEYLEETKNSNVNK